MQAQNKAIIKIVINERKAWETVSGKK
jgi:hypothetical protein